MLNEGIRIEAFGTLTDSRARGIGFPLFIFRMSMEDKAVHTSSLSSTVGLLVMAIAHSTAHTIIQIGTSDAIDVQRSTRKLYQSVSIRRCKSCWAVAITRLIVSGSTVAIVRGIVTPPHLSAPVVLLHHIGVMSQLLTHDRMIHYLSFGVHSFIAVNLYRGIHVTRRICHLIGYFTEASVIDINMCPLSPQSMATSLLPVWQTMEIHGRNCICWVFIIMCNRTRHVLIGQ